MVTTTVVQCSQCSKEELMVILGLPMEETEERAVVAMVVCEYFENHKEEQ